MKDLNKQIIETFHHIVLFFLFLGLAGLVVFFAVNKNVMGVVLSTGSLCTLLLLRVLWFLVHVVRNQHILTLGVSNINNRKSVYISAEERGLIKIMWSALGTNNTGSYTVK